MDLFRRIAPRLVLSFCLRARCWDVTSSYAFRCTNPRAPKNTQQQYQRPLTHGTTWNTSCPSLFVQILLAPVDCLQPYTHASPQLRQCLRVTTGVIRTWRSDDRLVPTGNSGRDGFGRHLQWWIESTEYGYVGIQVSAPLWWQK